MRSTCQFPLEAVFCDLPQEPPRDGRHSEVVAKAKALANYNNVFVDCNSSIGRIAFARNVLPCITPTHSIYSAGLGRYMTTEDLLQAQGLWRSCFKDDVYNQLLKTCGQDIAGNSFSSTVCQAVVMASFATAPAAWDTLLSRDVDSDDTSKRPSLKRRLREKQPAPEYGLPNRSIIVKSKSVKQQLKRKRAQRPPAFEQEGQKQSGYHLGEGAAVIGLVGQSLMQTF